MKVLAVVGTNRRNGLIVRLCSKILEGAKENGHDTELVNLYDYKIGACMGCWACAEGSACILKDDFPVVFEKVRTADVIVLASPCYWGNVTGVMKNFFDRHTGCAMVGPKNASSFSGMSFGKKAKILAAQLKSFGAPPEIAGKRFIIVTSMTVPFPVSHISGDLRGVVGAMKIYVSNLKGRVISKIVYTDSLFRFLKKKERRYMRKARRIGNNL